MIDPATCGARLTLDVARRPGNALNIEVGTAMPRCINKPPDHWRGASALRWLGSGGSPLVFGVCTPMHCPLDKSTVPR